jgi:DNA-binding beta-propeller fold protein YncE
MKLKLILTTAIAGMALASFAAVAPAQAAPFVYVTNIDGANLSQYDAAGGLLSPLSPPTVSTQNNATGIAVSPDGTNVYVTTPEPAAIFQFSVGATGGLTLRSTAPVPPGALPTALAVSPNGQNVYIRDAGGLQPLIQYTVEADGALTLKSPPTVPTGPGPAQVAVSPDSRSVYATNTVEGESTVSQYTAAADGTLSPKSPPNVPVGQDDPTAELSGLAISPDGRSLYVANFEALITLTGTVFQFTVGADGTLTAKSPPSVPAPTHPTGLVVSPDGHSVYVSNAAGTILQYTVQADGTLTPKSPPSVAAGTGPGAPAISADGKSLYAPNQGDGMVLQYTVQADGTLTPKSPPSVAAGSGPHEIAITPTAGMPTSNEQCKNGGWRNFPQFKNQGQCIAFVNHGP